MQKVYALEGGCITDRHVLGIFSSEKKAEAAKKWLIENDTYYKYDPDDLEIQVFELNGERLR